MSDGTETIEQEELVDETPLDEEVSGDEITPESEEGQPGDVEDEGDEEEQKEEIPAVEPQAPDIVQQQLDALTQQQAQTMQHMQGLMQALTQMSQQRQPAPGPAAGLPAAPAPGMDFESMSSKELVTHVLNQIQAQYAQPMAHTARQMQNIMFRLQQYGDAMALLGQNHPDFKHVNGAFELMTKVPGTSFNDALRATKGLALAEQNTDLKKKQRHQEKSARQRRNKAKGQGGRPDNRPKKKIQAKTTAEALEQLKDEGHFGGS